MAGAGYKLFNTGDVLLASEVNTYLMQQTVMVFANATARTSALSGVLAEGMISYLADTNATEVYNGSAWVSVSGTGDITEVTAGTGISGGGTTGAVTVTNSMATAIDAKGDLIVGTGSDTFARLAVGTNGHTLVADSAEATGLKWAAPGGSDQNWSLVNTGGTDLTGTSTTTISGISGANGLFILMDTLNTSSNYELYLRFNSDTGNNYAVAGGVYLSGSTYAASNVQRLGANISASYITVGGFSTNTGSNLQAGFMLWGCNTAGVKVGTLTSGSTAAGGDSNYLVAEHIAYFGTSAISSITVYLSGGTFDSGSTNKVYIYKTA